MATCENCQMEKDGTCKCEATAEQPTTPETSMPASEEATPEVAPEETPATEEAAQ